MDVHRCRLVLVRMTETGEHLETVRISNDPEYLRAVMARAGEAPEVVLEATYGWYWAADTLAELVWGSDTRCSVLTCGPRVPVGHG
jgi:hypothetical protein